MTTLNPLPPNVTAGLSSGAAENLTAIAARVQQLQKQGIPEQQVSALIQQELTTVPNMIPLTNAYALYNYLKAHPTQPQPVDPDSVAVSMAKTIAAQDQQKKMAQAQRAQMMAQQQAPAPAPQQDMRNTGIASLPAGNLGNNFAAGGIVAFDEGGNIQSQQIAARMAAPQTPQAQGLTSLPAYLASADVNQGDVDFAAAHGGPVRRYDDGGDVTAGTGGIKPLNIYHAGKLDYNALLQNAAQQAESMYPTGSYMNQIKAREKEMGIGEGYNRFLQIHADSLDQAQKNYEMSNQLAQQAGAAAGLQQASLLGNQAGYAGQGLSGLLASVGANAAATTKAKMEALRDLNANKFALAKLEAQGTIDHEHELQRNLRTDVQGEMGMQRDKQAAMNNAVEAGVRLGSLQQRDAEFQQNQARMALDQRIYGDPIKDAERALYNDYLKSHPGDYNGAAQAMLKVNPQAINSQSRRDQFMQSTINNIVNNDPTLKLKLDSTDPNIKTQAQETLRQRVEMQMSMFDNQGGTGAVPAAGTPAANTPPTGASGTTKLVDPMFKRNPNNPSGL